MLSGCSWLASNEKEKCRVVEENGKFRGRCSPTISTLGYPDGKIHACPCPWQTGHLNDKEIGTFPLSCVKIRQGNRELCGAVWPQILVHTTAVVSPLLSWGMDHLTICFHPRFLQPAKTWWGPGEEYSWQQCFQHSFFQKSNSSSLGRHAPAGRFPLGKESSHMLTFVCLTSTSGHLSRELWQYCPFSTAFVHHFFEDKTPLLIQCTPSQTPDARQPLDGFTKLFLCCLQEVIGLLTGLPDRKGQGGNWLRKGAICYTSFNFVNSVMHISMESDAITKVGSLQEDWFTFTWWRNICGCT